MQPKLILFDCRNTLIYKKNLVETTQRFFRRELKFKISAYFLNYAFNIMYQRHKFQHPRFTTAHSREFYYQKYNQEQLRILGIDLPDFLAIKLNKELKSLPYGIFPDVLPTLKFLKSRNYILGVLANWTETLPKILNDLELKAYFEFIFSSHDLKATKPSTLFFKKALARLKFKNSDILYIGDDYELDIVPANKMNLQTILIDRSHVYPDNIECRKIKNFIELKSIL